MAQKPVLTIDDMISAGDGYVLPVDVRVHHNTIRAGCTVGTVLRSIKVQAEAMWASATLPSRELCEDCPPVDYPTDETRCLPCPRRRA